jgi:hypothetical protein
MRVGVLGNDRRSRTTFTDPGWRIAALEAATTRLL